MSRIDQALTAWEATPHEDESQARPIPSAVGLPLSAYPLEEPLRPEHERATLPVSSPESNKAPDRDSHVNWPITEANHLESTDGSLEFDAPTRGRRATQPADVRDHETQEARSHKHADSHARLVTTPTNTVALEQYRRLAAVLHDLQTEKQLKTVMITSAVPQEGKTLTVLNLALTLSESYARRVLMIDADLRLPSLHEVLGIPNHRGLTETLRSPHHDLPLVEMSAHLSVMTAGQTGPAPLAGLSSGRIGEVIDECAARFDWVIIDTSPVGVLPDASVLARRVGGVIFVIRAGSTPAAVVERAVAEIGSDALIGTVLNRVEERLIPGAGYYRQYGNEKARRQS